MRQLTSIVAMNAEGAIGAGNGLPWRVRTDMRFFRSTTLDQVVIMGRKTQQSLGGCLPRRINLVLTHRFSLFASTPHCRAVGAIEEALVEASRVAKKREVFIVGGATMYEQFVPYVDRYLVTMIDKHVPDADTFFDAGWLNEEADWDRRLIAEGMADGENDEADFRIWEFVAKRSAEFANRRSSAIQAFERRRQKRLIDFRPSAVAQA